MLATGQCNAEEEKYNSILNFLKEYQLGASKKKLRDLMTYTEPNLEGYKINIIIAHCCKVSTLYKNNNMFDAECI